MLRTALFFILCWLCPLQAAEVDLTAVDGARLVTLLDDPAMAQRAHYALWRRAEPQADKGWIDFVRSHYAHWIVSCPQGPKLPPITLVLYGFLDSNLRQGDYPSKDLDTLFPAEPASFSRPVEEPAIDAFTADGRRISPFDGNNVLNRRGVLADVDGDGFIERVDTINCSVDGVKQVTVMEIVRVREQAEPLFAAVINWGEDEWNIEAVPATATTPGEVRLGPLDATGKVQTRAVVRVDPTHGAWGLVGKPPAGHVRQLDSHTWWDGLKALKDEGLTFIADPSAGDEPSDQSTSESTSDSTSATIFLEALQLDGRVSGHAAVAPREPYAYRPLGTDPVLVAAFMSTGRSIRDLEAQQRLVDVIPKEVWTLPPREAALALADANRSPAHRQRFRLAVDDRDGRQPPATLVVDLSSDSSRCYSDRRSIWRLKAAPSEAALTLARVTGGVVFRNPGSVVPEYDLRSQGVDPALARQVAEVLWWLDRIRSLDRIGDRNGRLMISSSTADGSGLLQVTDDNGVEQYARSGRLWHASIPEQWIGAFEYETTLNLARLLVIQGLVARVDSSWLIDSEQSSSELHEADKQLHETAQRLLTQPQAMSNGILLRVVQASGIHAWKDLDADLQHLAASLTQNLPPLRTYAQIEAEIEALKNDHSAGAQVILYQELFTFDQRQAQSEQALSAAIVEARARIAVGDDAAALEAWASSNQPGWQWALARLHALDRIAYVRALETGLEHSTGAQARSFYTAIATADPARAKALTAALPQDQPSKLAIDVLSLVTKANAITEIGPRVEALIALLIDQKQGPEIRGQALELLVPPSEPQRYPQPAIDAALAKVLIRDKADLAMHYTLGRACTALARREQVAHLDLIFDLLDTSEDSWVRPVFLAAAVDLAQQVGGAARERLAHWIAHQLERTNLIINEVLWAAWALDLRELAPVIAGIATASGNDYEGPMASSYGGTPRLVAKHRYHFARQISQLWSEPDPASRAVLLLSLDGDNSQTWEDPARTRRRLAEFTAMQGDAKVRSAVEGWCAAWPGISHTPAMTAHLAKATSVIGVTLAEPNP